MSPLLYAGDEGWRGGSSPADNNKLYAGNEGWCGGSSPADNKPWRIR
jgi:hypothetical protein